MDHLDALQPFSPYDATVTLTDTLAPSDASPHDLPHGWPSEPSRARSDRAQISAARLAALETELHDLQLDCWRLARRTPELSFTIVGHNEIAALNERLVVVQAFNLTQREYHRSPVVSAWPTPPLPTNVLLSVPDFIPYLSAALLVLARRPRSEAAIAAWATRTSPTRSAASTGCP